MGLQLMERLPWVTPTLVQKLLDSDSRAWRAAAAEVMRARQHRHGRLALLLILILLSSLSLLIPN